MSTGPKAGPLASTPPQNDKLKRLPPLGSRALPSLQSTNGHGSPRSISSNSPTAQNNPARSPSQSSTMGDQRSSRLIGVKNLLNPTTTKNSASSRDSRDYPSGPSSTTTISPVATPSLSAPLMVNRSPNNVSLPSITPPAMGLYSQPMSRTPSHYGPNSVTVNPPNGTIDVKQSPFVLPRDHSNLGASGTYNASEVTRVPSLSGETSGSSFPLTRSPRSRRSSQDDSQYARMQILLGRTGAAGPGAHPPASQPSDSPSTQYSSYSQVSQTPPTAIPSAISTGQPQSFFTAPFNAQSTATTMSHMAFSAPTTSSATGGSTYQMMTLDTENGPIQVPVDVQAASKVADEKRKRNATASHRFRQRRKEKERETSQNIAKLEQQIREVEEDREHYRRERDHYRSVVDRLPGQAHALPRPISPRQRRHASMGGAVTGFPGMQYQGPDGGNRTSGRNTRRRTSAYIPPPGPALPVPESHSIMPPFEHQNGNRLRLQEPLSLKNGSYNAPAMR